MAKIDNDWVNGRCIEVVVGNQHIEKALSKFKQKIKNSKLMVILQENSYYRKPSEIRRKKENRWKVVKRYETRIKEK